MSRFNPVVATVLLGLSMFFTGASGLVNEYVLSTVSTYILGSSIEQFSLTIAVMMGMMGVGGWAQKYVKDDYLIEKFVFIEILLSLLGSFSPICIYAAFGYFEHSFLLVYYFFVVFIGFLIGFEIPFIIRINQQYAKELKSNLSVVMAADYIGSFIGALVWVYVLLPNVALTKVSFIITGANFCVAFFTFLYFLRCGLLQKKLFLFMGVFLTFVFMFMGFQKVSSWELFLEQKLYADKVISSQTTKYQHMTLTHNKSLDEYRLYINGNIQFSSLDEERYHEQLVHPVMALSKKRDNVLILGGGDGFALREIKKYKDVKTITLVELDPKIVSFAKNNPVLKKLNQNAFLDARVRVLQPRSFSSLGVKDIYALGDKEAKSQWVAQVEVLHLDADMFLQKFQKSFYDVVFIDFPDPSSIELNKLYTKEFFLKLKAVMKKDALFVMQSTSPYHAKEAFLCIGRTMRAAGLNVLPFHDNIPSFGDWGWYMAWQSSLSKKNFVEKIDALQNFEVSTSYLTPNVFRKALVFGKGELSSQNNAVNTLMRPVLYHIYNKNSWLVY